MFGTCSDDIAARPRPPATVRDLEIALLEEWNSIPQSLIDNFIASMANRGPLCQVRYILHAFDCGPEKEPPRMTQRTSVLDRG
ncbi:hypothetical protein TNCV_2402331 [Trichonephila clavipes]|nr:hypothetical protein TNCV_2402331 [Trichonephila clavipes]